MTYFKNLMAAFSRDENGAVTVDFVVLTAGAVLIAAGVGSALSTKITAGIGKITL